MNKSIYILLLVSFLSFFTGTAQVLDNPINNGGEIPSQINKDKNTIQPTIKRNNDSPIKLFNPLEAPKTFSMEKDPNLVDASKAAEGRIKEVNNKLEGKTGKKGSVSDQYLGDVTVKGDFISIECRDHQYVDGDRVKVIVNDVVVAQNIFLNSYYKGINVDLKEGLNEIHFVALNQGESGPNTAQFRVFNLKGELVTQKEWNLQTGVKATIIVVNEK
ncbi:hypothetical protein [Pseudofulvibacter geojedonensis]|uniref:Secreted protein n=1 Tax=Pseudofulvibacter geojedonensis TaxID=1123758 RepID=A0ABW3HXY2_9FLAO